MSTPPMKPAGEERTAEKGLKPRSPHSVSSTSTDLGTDSESDASSEEKHALEQEWRTTVMLRNLPNNYTRSMLLQHINEKGYAGLYDFFYLPIDFKSQACLGYAFINLHTPEDACALMNDFDGFANWLIPTRKRCMVGWSNPHQGLRSNIERYQNSPVMHRDVPDAFKPCIFHSQGLRANFPPATKRLRCPRVRTLTVQDSRRLEGPQETRKDPSYELAAGISASGCQRRTA